MPALTSHQIAQALLRGTDRPLDILHGHRKVIEIVDVEYTPDGRVILIADDYDGADD